MCGGGGKKRTFVQIFPYWFSNVFRPEDASVQLLRSLITTLVFFPNVDGFLGYTMQNTTECVGLAARFRAVGSLVYCLLDV